MRTPSGGTPARWRRPPMAVLAAVAVLVVLGAVVLQCAISFAADSARSPAVTALPSPPVLSTEPLPEPSGVSVLTFGATGDGTTDDTAALRRALAAGGPLLFPAGLTFAHSDVLEVTRPGTRLAGGGTLLATDEARSGVWIAADDVTVEGLTFRMGATTRRWSAPAQMKVRLLPRTGITLRNVTISGSAAAGIFVGGASNYLISDVLVTDTRADGIHQTGGAHDGRIVRPVIRNAGDDSVAVVSYQRDGEPCHDIRIESPQSFGNVSGRAFSVVGGRDIAWSDIYADRSDSAGLYIATEGAPWFTASTQGVTVTGGTLVRSNKNPRVGHGAVIIFAGNQDTVVTAIDISGLVISETRPSAHADVGIRNGGGSVSRVAMTGVAISGGPRDAFESTAPPAAYRLANWTKDGIALPDRLGW